MVLPTLRDGDLVLRPKRLEDAGAITAACQDPEIRFQDTGELVDSPRAGTEEPIYAVYVWRRT